MINMSFDTLKKSCSVSMDGKEMGNMTNLNVYKCGKDYCLEMRQMTEDEDNDMMQYTGLMASLINQMNLTRKPKETISKF